MASQTDLIQQQTADYSTLLHAVEALLGSAFDTPDMDAFLALQGRVLGEIHSREGQVMQALLPLAQDAPERAAFRHILEQVAAAEQSLMAAAQRHHVALGDHFKQLGHSSRALSGYRSSERGDTARAISQRV